MSTPSQRVQIPGPAGVLELVLDAPPPEQPLQGVAVIAHPHPLFGGSLDNKVVHTLARACVLAGYQALRFNFRGVGASSGSYDAGQGELADLLAVLAYARAQAPGLPVVLAGFSFGAFVTSHALAALPADATLAGVVLVGTAASRFAVAPIDAAWHTRCLVLHGEQDDTVPLADVFDWARPQGLPVTVVPGVGHFFHGQLPLLRTLVLRHLRALSLAS